MIELLVVIAIIGILSSVVLASLNTARLKSRDTRRVADIKQLQLALALYFDTAAAYPPNNAGAWKTALAPTYIAVVPKDPVSGNDYAYSGLGSGATCSSYHLGAVLEDTANQALTGDADAAVGTICTNGGADFSGLSAAAGTCSATPGTAQPSGTETCYDAKP